MRSMFIDALNMSITAGYCVLFVLFLRLCLKRQPKIFSYALWSIPYVRLVCPFSLLNIFSFVRFNNRIIPRGIEMQTEPRIDSGIALIDSTVNQVIADSPLAADVTNSVNPLQLILFLAGHIWLIGIAVILLYSILSAWRLHRRLRTAVKMDWEEIHTGLTTDADQMPAVFGMSFVSRYPVYEAAGLPTAFVFGIFHPAIYLPAGLPLREKRYVLLHELTHVRRRDYLIKIAAFCITAYHWFNPLAWAAYVLMGSDMEMSCDEAVIRSLGKEVKKEYSTALLSLATERRMFRGSPLAFGEGKAGGRIRNILRYKKRTLAVTAALAVVVGIAVVGLLTNAPEDDSAAFTNPTGGENAQGISLEAYELADSVVFRTVTDVVDSGTSDAHVSEINLDDNSLQDFLITYATVFCTRDGNRIAGLYVSPEAALKYGYNIEPVDGDTYTFGLSSPWPWDTDFRIVNYPNESMAEIYYYACTSDPTITVWKEKAYYTTVGDEYRLTSTECTEYDSMASAKEVREAYNIGGLYHFADLTPVVSAIRYQLANGDSMQIGQKFLQPDTAAEYILHLKDGRAAVKKNGEHRATVTYTFADGSSVEIPMYQPNAGADADVSAGYDVWIVDFETWNGVIR